MVPAGAPTRQTIETLLGLLSEGDLIADGGNSKWTESIVRHAQCAEHGVDFVESEYRLDLARISHLWGQGSVVRSWLLELAARAFEADGNDLAGLEGYVEDSGEGRWTLESGVDHDVPMPALTAALFARFYSRGNGDYAARMLAALRNQFGGHAVKTAPRP